MKRKDAEHRLIEKGAARHDGTPSAGAKVANAISNSMMLACRSCKFRQNSFGRLLAVYWAPSNSCSRRCRGVAVSCSTASTSHAGVTKAGAGRTSRNTTMSLPTPGCTHTCKHTNMHTNPHTKEKRFMLPYPAPCLHEVLSETIQNTLVAMCVCGGGEGRGVSGDVRVIVCGRLQPIAQLQTTPCAAVKLLE